MMVMTIRWKTLCYISLLLFSMVDIYVEAVLRRVSLNSALHLECRNNQTIKINSVKLGKERPQCSQALRSDHSDYMRVVSECSGLQSCSNIVLKESTSIACTNYGLQDSEYMEVDYTCIQAFNVLSMCHNTVRTMSLYEGYLASPDYPSLPGDVEGSVTGSQQNIVCSCQLVAVLPTAHLQLRLVDMYNSKQVQISESTSRSRYLCNDKTNGRCIEDIHQSRHSSLNITYRPSSNKPTKFFLQYNAGRKSRVSVSCKMTETILEDNDLTSSSTTKQILNSKEENKLEDEILSLEVIAGICVTAIVVLICVIVSVMICRRRCNKRKQRSRQGNNVFRAFTPEGNPTYDMVPNEHHYATITSAKNDKRMYDNVYNEPAATGLPGEYSEPRIRYQQDYHRSAGDNRLGYNSRASDGSGIYESMEHIRADNPQRISRVSNKCGSMPLHPAPPVPCSGASVKLKQQSFNPKSTTQVACPVESLYDIPQTGKQEQIVTAHSMSSTDSIPKIDLDLSDLLAETDKRFVRSHNNYSSTPNPANTEYMLPVQVHSTDTMDYKLIENALYIADE